MKNSGFSPPLSVAQNAATVPTPPLTRGNGRGQPAAAELADFRALSREVLHAARLADALERAGVVSAVDHGAPALLSLTGGETAPDRRERAASATSLASELDGSSSNAPSVSGPTSGQLMAAAHTIANYVLTGSSGALATAAETLVPRGSKSLSIRLSYVTPEGGHAAIELVHPDLGDLAIEVSLNARSLSLLATAESERSAGAIRAGQDALARKLAAQGITLQSLTVVVCSRRPPDRGPKEAKRQED